MRHSHAPRPTPQRIMALVLLVDPRDPCLSHTPSISACVHHKHARAHKHRAHTCTHCHTLSACVCVCVFRIVVSLSVCVCARARVFASVTHCLDLSHTQCHTLFMHTYINSIHDSPVLCGSSTSGRNGAGAQCAKRGIQCGFMAEWVDSPITTFNDKRFNWSCGVPQHNVEAAGTAISITPTPGLDYWSRTFYEPLLVKHDAQCLLTRVDADKEATLTTAFTLKPRAQFDQAGIMVLVDESTWVKAGIEYTDGSPRLSCVVTNDGFSDWSTQQWLDWDSATQSTSIRVRVSKLLPGRTQGPALVFEAAPWVEGSRAESAAPWVQIRIASLRSGAQPWRMGLFAISPIEGAGCSAFFHHIQLGPKQESVHGLDAGTVKAEL